MKLYIYMLTGLLFLSTVMLYFINKESNKLNQESFLVNENFTIKQKAMSGLIEVVSNRTNILLQIYHEIDPFERDDLRSKLSAHSEKFIISRDMLQSTQITEQEQLLLKKMLYQVRLYMPLEHEILDLMTEDKIKEAGDILFAKALPIESQLDLYNYALAKSINTHNHFTQDLLMKKRGKIQNYTNILGVIFAISAVLMMITMIGNIKRVNESELESEVAHNKIKDSIKYSSLIQQAILPNKKQLNDYVNASLIIWQPKDIVGGDIYFINELDSHEEIVIMMIDGAGHGVSGSFVTMLVKAIETQIISDINAGKLKPSPALILQQFNRQIKLMLKQEKGSRSNAGLDGGVLYYNKAAHICTYAGAKTPLYIVDSIDDNNEVKIIKSDRVSVGYVRTKIDQTYTEYNIDIKEGTKLYMATDGLTDQINNDDVVFSKARFRSFIETNNNETFATQKAGLLEEFDKHKEETEQIDDVTVIGLAF